MTIAKNVGYDPRNVLPCDYIGATDPALDAANGVQAGKTWAETDEDPPVDFTEVVGYWIRNLANDTWVAFTVAGAPPSGAAGGALTGTYPNPTVASDVALPGNPTTTTQSSGNSSTRIATTAFVADAVAKQLEVLIIAIGDETTAITTGTAKVTFRMPFAMTLTAVRASLTTASSSGNPTFDLNEAGTTVLSTKLSIDSGEKTSTTAATPAVISDAALADDAEMTIDVDAAGTGAAGGKIYLIGTRA